MKKTILISIILSSIISCNESKKVERTNEPTIYGVESVDVEMNNAIQKAKQTLPEFYKALETKNSNYEGLGIKMIFKTEDRNEHIWINGLFKKDNQYFGIVDNQPEYSSEIHLGDTVKIDNDRISDWMYLENSELKGGYTIRLLRQRMSEIEREDFDKTTGMIIK